MDFSTICDLIIAVCGIIPTIVAVVMLVKNIIETKNWNLVVEIANKAMTTVEEYAKEHPEMTSDDKLNMALDAIKEGLGVAGISVDEDLIKRIIAYINEMCAWSKTVNATVVEAK